MPAQTRMRFAFDIFVIAFFAYTAWEALDFRTLARYLPLTVSVLALILSVLALIIDYRNWKRSGNVMLGEVSETAAMYTGERSDTAVSEEGSAVPAAMDEAQDEAGRDEAGRDEAGQDEADDPRAILRRAGIMVLWTLGYILGIWVVGLMAATAIFLVAFLFLEGRTGWKPPIIGTAIVLGGIAILAEMLNLAWPDYLLQRLWS